MEATNDSSPLLFLDVDGTTQWILAPMMVLMLVQETSISSLQKTIAITSRLNCIQTRGDCRAPPALHVP